MPNTFNEMETTTELSISCGCVPSCARFGLYFGHCFGLCQCCHRSRAAKALLRDARANESSRSLTPSSSSCSSHIWLLYLALFRFFCCFWPFSHFEFGLQIAAHFHFTSFVSFQRISCFLYDKFLWHFIIENCADCRNASWTGDNGEVLGQFQLNRANRWLNYLFANAKFSAKLFAQLI